MNGKRYKPVGWRGESYRHYLAAKGIKTRYNASKIGKLLGEAAKADLVDTGSQSARAQRRRSLLAQARQQEAEQRAEIATRPVRQPQLSAEERQKIKRSKETEGIRGITESTAWRFWQPQDAIRDLKRLVEDQNAVRERISKLQRVANNPNTREETKVQAEQEIEQLKDQSSELTEDIEINRRILARIQAGLTRKQLIKERRQYKNILSRQAVPRLRQEGVSVE